MDRLKLFGRPDITEKDVTATISLILITFFSLSFFVAVLACLFRGDAETVKWLFATVTPFVASIFAYYVGKKTNAPAPGGNPDAEPEDLPAGGK